MKYIYIVQLLCIVIIYGCAADNSGLIIGKWNEVDKEENIEFFTDSTFQVSGGGLSFNGRYSFVEKDKVKLEINMFGTFIEPRIWTIKIYSDLLIITDENGENTKFERVTE